MYEDAETASDPLAADGIYWRARSTLLTPSSPACDPTDSVIPQAAKKIEKRVIPTRLASHLGLDHGHYTQDNIN
jgi:hypothetical protein